MIPLHALLSRIRWDAAFGAGRFVIGYEDRLAGGIVRVDLAEVVRDEDNPALLVVVDAEGRRHRIPQHRVREVLRDGMPIWQRAR